MHARFKLALSLVPAAVLLSLAGCATTHNVPDGKKLASDQGLVTLQINAGDTYVLDFIPYAATTGGKAQLEKPSVELVVQPGLHYYVLPMKQGQYQLGYINGDMHYSNWTGYADLGKWGNFSVQPGEITYIGLLRFQTKGLADQRSLSVMAFNYDKSMKDYLTSNYPSDMQSMAYNDQLLKRE